MGSNTLILCKPLQLSPRDARRQHCLDQLPDPPALSLCPFPQIVRLPGQGVVFLDAARQLGQLLGVLHAWRNGRAPSGDATV
jgi:hypothetical protein